MIRYLRALLAKRTRYEPADSSCEVFEQQRTPPRHDRLFLAVLEMVKMQAVVVTQRRIYSANRASEAPRLSLEVLVLAD